MTRQIGHSAFSMPSSAAAPVRPTGCFQYTTESTAAITAAMAHALKPGILSPARATISHRIGSIASRKFSTNISPLLLWDPGAYGPLYKVFRDWHFHLVLPICCIPYTPGETQSRNQRGFALFCKNAQIPLCIFAFAISPRKCLFIPIIPKNPPEFFLFISFCTFLSITFIYTSQCIRNAGAAPGDLFPDLPPPFLQREAGGTSPVHSWIPFRE